MLARGGTVIADDLGRVRFSSAEHFWDDYTGKPVAGRVVYEYDDGGARYRITFQRAKDLARVRFLDILPGMQRFLARLACFDGAYIRFTGTATLERFQDGMLVETVSQQTAVWELMYFGQRPRAKTRTRTRVRQPARIGPGSVRRVNGVECRLQDAVHVDAHGPVQVLSRARLPEPVHAEGCRGLAEHAAHPRQGACRAIQDRDDGSPPLVLRNEPGKAVVSAPGAAAPVFPGPPGAQQVDDARGHPFLLR